MTEEFPPSEDQVDCNHLDAVVQEGGTIYCPFCEQVIGQVPTEEEDPERWDGLS